MGQLKEEIKQLQSKNTNLVSQDALKELSLTGYQIKYYKKMDQTGKIDTPKSSDTMCFGTSSAIIKANISESTNVEFPTNASQVSEMKNFSGGAISEVLPIRGGEVVPIVAGNLFSPMFMYA